MVFCTLEHGVFRFVPRFLSRNRTFWLVKTHPSKKSEQSKQHHVKGHEHLTKGHENFTRKYCLYLGSILFKVTWAFRNMWEEIQCNSACNEFRFYDIRSNYRECLKREDIKTDRKLMILLWTVATPKFKVVCTLDNNFCLDSQKSQLLRPLLCQFNGFFIDNWQNFSCLKATNKASYKFSSWICIIQNVLLKIIYSILF